MELDGRLRLQVHRTNGSQDVRQVVACALMHTPCHWLCVVVTSHAPSACATAPACGLADRGAGGWQVGFISVAFVVSLLFV